jgi:hypothetical protein
MVFVAGPMSRSKPEILRFKTVSLSVTNEIPNLIVEALRLIVETLTPGRSRCWDYEKAEAIGVLGRSSVSGWQPDREEKEKSRRGQSRRFYSFGIDKLWPELKLHSWLANSESNIPGPFITS